MRREDLIREVESMLPSGGYQVAKSVVLLAGEPEGTFRKVGKSGRKRPMSQAEAARLVERARTRVALADSGD